MARAGLFAHCCSHMMGTVYEALDVKGLACVLIDSAIRDRCGIIRLARVWGRGYFFLIVAFDETSAKMEFATKYFFLLSNHFMTNYSIQIIYHLVQKFMAIQMVAKDI